MTFKYIYKHCIDLKPNGVTKYYQTGRAAKYKTT